MQLQLKISFLERAISNFADNTVACWAGKFAPFASNDQVLWIDKLVTAIMLAFKWRERAIRFPSSVKILVLPCSSVIFSQISIYVVLSLFRLCLIVFFASRVDPGSHKVCPKKLKRCTNWLISIKLSNEQLSGTCQPGGTEVHCGMLDKNCTNNVSPPL